MNILVTGHNGFIGSRITKRYKELGYNVLTIEGDILSKQYVDDLDKLVGNDRIRIINHHAAQTDVRNSGYDPEFDAKQNIIGTLKILRLCEKYGVKKLIYSSSGGACYGNSEKLPISEDDATNPISHYGLSKLVGEEYIKLSNISYTILRYSNVWSEDCNKGIYAILRDNPEPTIFGNGNSTRDYVHVDDVVESNVLALTRGKDEIINIGTGKGVSINQLMEKYGCFYTKPLYIEKNSNEVDEIFLNISKAKNVLRWKPNKQII